MGQLSFILAQESFMTVPINLTLKARVYILPTRTEIQIEPTPRILYDLIPVKETRTFKTEYVKDVEFTFKRKRFVLCFYYNKTQGET